MDERTEDAVRKDMEMIRRSFALIALTNKLIASSKVRLADSRKLRRHMEEIQPLYKEGKKSLG